MLYAMEKLYLLHYTYPNRMLYGPPAIMYVFSPYKFIWMICLEFMLQLCTMHADLVPSSTHLPPTIPSQITSSSSYLAYQQTSSALLTSTLSPSPKAAVVSYTSTSNEGISYLLDVHANYICCIVLLYY